LLGFANSIHTVDGGTHMEGLRAGLTKTVTTLGRKSKLLKGGGDSGGPQLHLLLPTAPQPGGGTLDAPASPRPLPGSSLLSAHASTLLLSGAAQQARQRQQSPPDAFDALLAELDTGSNGLHHPQQQQQQFQQHQHQQQHQLLRAFVDVQAQPHDEDPLGLTFAPSGASGLRGGPALQGGRSTTSSQQGGFGGPSSSSAAVAALHELSSRGGSVTLDAASP
ncbi:DNA gyrase subunit B, mitochondrial, partial [Tetrabaena socialis]